MGIGTRFDGGFAQRARVDAAWVTPVPKNIDSFTAAAIGTAGYTAALAVLALQNHYVTPKSGPVLVTGASGGAGSVAVALLAALGYHVVASTGRAAEQTYLRGLGAREVIDRSELSGAPQGPVGAERWAGAIDAVGSNTLGNVVAGTNYGATVAALVWRRASISRSPSSRLSPVTSPLPGSTEFYTPAPQRSQAWQLLADTLERSVISTMTRIIPLAGAIQTSIDTLSGKVKGRVVVDVNA